MPLSKAAFAGNRPDGLGADHVGAEFFPVRVALLNVDVAASVLPA